MLLCKADRLSEIALNALKIIVDQKNPLSILLNSFSRLPLIFSITHDCVLDHCDAVSLQVVLLSPLYS